MKNEIFTIMNFIHSKKQKNHEECESVTAAPDGLIHICANVRWCVWAQRK